MLLWSTYVGIERLIAHNRARKRSMILAAEVVGPLQQGDIAGALELTKDEQFKNAYLGALLQAGLSEMELRLDEHGLAAAKMAIDKAIGEELSKLRRGMGILATTGATAPFVGLFGTTFGVINAFQGMATAGAGLAGISAGISEALITTGVGIGVAIIGVWLFNYYNQRVDKVGEELASSEADFLDWATKLVLTRKEASARAGK
jgi:biopolymer transport protein ExbB/biopolymer transport protein TolQ